MDEITSLGEVLAAQEAKVPQSLPMGPWVPHTVVDDVTPEMATPIAMAVDRSAWAAEVQRKRRYWAKGETLIASTQVPGEEWSEITRDVYETRVEELKADIEAARPEVATDERSILDRLADMVGVTKDELVAEIARLS